MGFGFAALDRSRYGLGGKGFRAGDGPEILRTASAVGPGESLVGKAGPGWAGRREPPLPPSPDPLNLVVKAKPNSHPNFGGNYPCSLSIETRS